MGNKFEMPIDWKEYEYKTGKKLLRAIEIDDVEQLDRCVELVKKELLKINYKISPDQEYDKRMENLTIYLTRFYEVGDGVVFKKTPLEYARDLKSESCMRYIQEKLALYSRTDSSATVIKNAANINSQKIETKQLGKIDNDRVKLAKERLIAYRNKGS